MTGRQRSPNRILRRIREVERQETREEFAESVVEAARALGVKIACNYRTIARWEDGETAMPLPAYRRALSALLDRPFRELGFAEPDKGEGNESNPNEHVDAAPAGSLVKQDGSTALNARNVELFAPYLDELSLLSETVPDSEEARERTYDRFVYMLSHWANNMKRRELLRLLGWAASAVAASPLYEGFDAGEQMRIARGIEIPSRVDNSLLDHIENVLWRLIQQDDALGAQATLETVQAQRNVVRLILPECPSRLRPRLLSLFSNFSLQTGWVLYDLTDFDSASYYYEHARTTAHEAQNTELGALVLCTMSHLATWRGQPRVGIDHAVAAQGWASQTNEPRLRAYAADVAARAFARDGQAAACMRQLDRAHENLTAPCDADGQSRMYFYTPGQLAGTRSHCLLQLGDVQGAIRAGEESLALVEPAFVRNFAFTKLFLGDAYMAANEIDQAAVIIGEAVSLAAQNRSARLLTHLRSAHQKLKPWQNFSAVRELDDQLQTYHLS